MRRDRVATQEMKYVFIIILAACGPSYGYVTPTQPWPIQIVSPIPQGEPLTKVTCYIPDLPNPPEEVRYDDPDIMYRAAVHVREYNDHIAYDRDMASWANMMDKCMRKLVEKNKKMIEIKPAQSTLPATQLPSRTKPPAPATP